MALQVWLPLNGNCKNKGVANATVTNNGATVDNSGKIGKCYYFNGSGYMTLPSFSTTKSICFWLKASKTNNKIAFVDYKSKLGFGFYSNYIVVTCAGYNKPCYNTDNFIENAWNHITLVKIEDDVLLYINGVLQTSRTTSDQWSNSVDGCYIGKRSTGYPITGYINDFRVYDHCLSQKEVKEIAQGLILHYKLDDPYLENTNNIDPCRNDLNTNKTVPTNLSRSTVDGTTVEIVNFAGYKCYKLTIDKDNVSSWWGCYILAKPLSFGASVGDTVTRSLMLYVPSGQTLPRSGNFEAIEGTSTNKKYHQYDYSKPDTWQRIWHTGTIADNAAHNNYIHYFCSLNAGQSAHLVCYFRDFQMEIKDHPTPYTDSFRNETNVYDSSGYGNHGTVTEQSNPVLVSDSPRYSNCVKFDTTAKYIQVTGLPALGNIYSISWWMYQPTNANSKMPWGYANGNRLNFYNLYCNTADGSNNPYYVPGTTTVITAPPIEKWHHMVQVGNGTTVNLYMDGQLYGQAKTFKPITGTTLILNGWNTNADYKLEGAQLSDFRIYSTALSEDDIKQLYRVGASIDNMGNVHSYEFDESELNCIEKTGVSNFNIKEQDTIAKIYKQVNPNLLQGTQIDSFRYERTTGMSTEFGRRFTPTQQLQTGTYYTFSALVRGNANMLLYTINTGGNQAFTYINKEDMDENEFKLFFVTFRVTGDRTINQIYPCSKYGESNTLVGDWYEIKENSIKLEEGEICTPWIPSETDDGYRAYNGMFVAKQFIEI